MISNSKTCLPWYYSILKDENTYLQLSHLDTVPKLSQDFDCELKVEEIPEEQFIINFKPDLQILYLDNLTHFLNDSSNSVYFNLGNPFITFNLDNHILDMKLKDSIKELDRQDNYMVITLQSKKLSIYQTLMQFDSNSLIIPGLRVFKNYESTNIPILLEYTGTVLKAKLLGYDLHMSSLSGLCIDPNGSFPSNVSTFWYPLTTELPIEGDQPGFLGFNININNKESLKLGLNPKTRVVRIEHILKCETRWLLYQEFNDIIFSEDNRLYTSNPVSGLLQLAHLSDSISFDDIKGYIGTYWSKAEVIERSFKNKMLKFVIEIQRQGNNVFNGGLIEPRPLILLPPHLESMDLTGLGLLTSELLSPQLGILKLYEIDSQHIIFEQDFSEDEPIIFWPDVEGFSSSDKNRLAERLEFIANSYKVNCSFNLFSLARLFILGLTLLLIAKALNLDINTGALKNVKDQIRNQTKHILENNLNAPQNLNNIFIYTLAALQYLGCGLYSEFPALINSILQQRINNLVDIYYGINFKSSAGLKLQIDFSAALLSRQISNTEYESTFLAETLLRIKAFKYYVQLDEDTQQGLGILQNIAGPTQLSPTGKILGSLASLSPYQCPSRYYGIFLQQVGLFIPQILKRFLKSEWSQKLTQNLGPYKLDIDNTLTLFDNNNKISRGPYSTPFDTNNLGIIGLKILAVDPNVEIELFAKVWKRILDLMLKSDYNIFSSGSSSLSILYWLTLNHRVDSLDFTCLQFFINPTSSCDKPPESGIKEVGYNISHYISRRDSIQVKIDLNSFDNDLDIIKGRVLCKEKSITLYIPGIRKVVKGSGSLRQKAEQLDICPKVLIIYAAAFLLLYALASCRNTVPVRYLTSTKFFDAYKIIGCSCYNKYLGFVDNSNLHTYFI